MAPEKRITVISENPVDCSAYYCKSVVFKIGYNSLDMSHIPIIDIEDYRDGENREKGFLYFEWIGNSLIVEVPHSHNFFMLLITQSSRGVHTIDFIEHEIKGRQIHFLFPGQVHHWDLPQDTHAIQLMISNFHFEKITSALNLEQFFFKRHPIVGLSEQEFNDLAAEFNGIKRELMQKPINWDIIYFRIQIIAQLVIQKNRYLYEDLRLLKTAPLMFEFLHLIDLHYKKYKSPLFYATQLNITANYLNILCQRKFKKTASTIINTRVLLEAQRQLSHRKYSIKEIAYYLGFYDQGHFAKFMKKMIGISPSKFREEELKKL